MSWSGTALILPDVLFHSKEYSHPNNKLCNLPRYMGHGDDRVPQTRMEESGQLEKNEKTGQNQAAHRFKSRSAEE